MTKRRRWLNKMNQRVRTLVNKYGVDKDDILARLDKIDGVYITDSGQINVFKKFYNDKLEEVVEDLIPTYLTVKEEVFTKTAIKDFIGPLSKDQIHKSIQGYFAWSHEAEEVVKAYYDFEDSLGTVTMATPEMVKFSEKLSELGKVWRKSDELPYHVVRDVLNEAKDLRHTAKTKADEFIAKYGGGKL